MEKTKTTKEVEKAKASDIKFKGKYIQAVGKRKSATATVRIYKTGTGAFVINNAEEESYFTVDQLAAMKQPLKLAGEIKDANVSVHVSGGGKKGQADAIRHGISMALLKVDAELRPSLKAKGWLTRDARIKERKKPGLKKARRAPQWAKR